MAVGKLSAGTSTLGRLVGVAALSVTALAFLGGTAAAASHTGGDKPSVTGTVSSVDGVATPGTCGTPDDNGVFVVTTTGGTPPVPVDTMVTVTPSTAFAEHKVAAPTFADVCVGYRTSVVGTDVDHAMTALAVAVTIPKATHVFGFVSSVDGDTTQGACGTAGADGTFTVDTVVDSTPTDLDVYVGADTSFAQAHVVGATFADVCVGLQADADGPSADGVVVAESVVVRIPKPIKVKGDVTSVDGDSAAGFCGVAGSAGDFTVLTTTHGVDIEHTVSVSTSTTYADAKDPAPSFVDVCVGGRALAIGTSPSGTLEAYSVAAYPAKG